MITATYIAIEGPDKVGKETQSKLLERKLYGEGYSVKRVEVPIRSIVSYKIIYWMLHNGLAKKFPNVFQFVQFFNKLIFQLTWLVYWRLKYTFIIFDRWAASAIVYGNASGANQSLNNAMCSLLSKPDLTIVMMGPAHTTRCDDEYESDVELQGAVREGYIDWANSQSNEKVVVISNQPSKADVKSKIWNLLDSRDML